MKTFLSCCIALLAPMAALAVTEEATDTQTGPRIDAAIGISPVLGRWTRTIDLIYDPDGAPAQFTRTADFNAALEEATELWEAVSGVHFELVGVDRDAPDDGDLPYAERDGLVRLAWAALDEDIATSSRLHFGEAVPDGSHLTYHDGSIELNNAGVFSDTSELSERLVNALGFILGLGRSETPNSVRYANPANFLRYPREDDIRALRVLYGPGTRGNFDPAVPVADWQYQPPSDARPSLRRHLFQPTQESPRGARFLISDEEFASIDGTVDDGAMLTFDAGGIGATDNREAIAVEAEIVVVDPFGYEHHRVPWGFSCPARQFCTSAGVEIAEASYLKTLPGRWQVYVEDVSRGWLAGSLLYSTQFLVTAQPAINHAPEVTVRAEPGLVPGSVAFALAASDADGDAVEVTWLLPGGDAIVEPLGADGLAVQTVDFGLARAHSMFVELRDDGDRYLVGADNEVAGAGFQTLVRLDVKLPFAGAADDFTVLSSANANAEFAAAAGQPPASETLAAIVDQAVPGSALSSAGGSSTASFWLNASRDGGATTGTVFGSSDAVLIAGAINPVAGHAGRPADIFVVIRSTAVDGTETWSFRERSGRFALWNRNLANLQPAYFSEALAGTEVVAAYDGFLPPGLHQVYLGYRVRESDVLHFSAVPLPVVVAWASN